MRVSIFGGARPKPGEAAYEEAFKLGRLLGEAGHVVLTGGYIGTMEAVSRGASEAGAHVIGVTCQEIENWRKTSANPWVKEEWRYPTLHERLVALIQGGDAAIALPGGAGTLAEVSMMWNQLLINAISPRPLILIGDAWQQVFSTLYRSQQEYIGEKDRSWIAFAASIGEAVDYLNHQS